MSRFEFDPAPSPGTNRTAPPSDCDRCGGDKFVPVTDDEHGAYMNCPDCNPPTRKQPVPADAWWKE